MVKPEPLFGIDCSVFYSNADRSSLMNLSDFGSKCELLYDEKDASIWRALIESISLSLLCVFFLSILENE